MLNETKSFIHRKTELVVAINKDSPQKIFKIN